MALVLADRVLETTTTAGSGTISLAGASVGYQGFSTGVGNGNQTYYAIVAQSGTEWEVGIGTYTSVGDSLSRDTVLASSSSGAKVTFSAGTKQVFVTYPAGKSVYFSTSGTISASSGKITDVATPTAATDAATKQYVDGLAGGIILESQITISTSYTLSSGKNGLSVGPVTIGSGGSVTVPTNQTYMVLNSSAGSGAGQIATVGKTIAMSIVFGG